MTLLAPLLLGIAFGWLLQRARLTRYDAIAGVYRLTDLTVLKFMLSALVAGAILVEAAKGLGFARPIPIAPTYVAGNLLGGALFGVAMALAGFCPGTIVGGAGEGSVDYLIPGILGLLAGGLAFGFAHDSFFPALAAIGSIGRVTIAGLIGANPWLVIILFSQIVLLLFYALERGIHVGRR